MHRSLNARWKALQAGTSHFLGQNFAKHSMLNLLPEGKQEYVWATSWEFLSLNGSISYGTQMIMASLPQISSSSSCYYSIYKSDEQLNQVLKWS